MTTALLTVPPRYDSAVSLILVNTIDEISSGVNDFVSPLKSTWMTGLPPLSTTLKGKCFISACTSASANFRPIRRLASKTVLAGFIATWFFAESPMRRSVSVNATKDGVVRLPWSLAMISIRSSLKIPTHE